jgi:hypothetical protein
MRRHIAAVLARDPDGPTGLRGLGPWAAGVLTVKILLKPEE